MKTKALEDILFLQMNSIHLLSELVKDSMCKSLQHVYEGVFLKIEEDINEAMHILNAERGNHELLN